jgi:hypothetical protein
LVEAKNKKPQTKYIHGSVAYELEPEINPKIVKKVKKARKNKNLHKYNTVGKLLIIFVLAFLLVYRFTMIMSRTYEIRDTKTQISQLNGDNENIRIGLAEKNNIKSVEEIATQKRGMIVPDSKNIMYISVKPLTLSSGKYNQSAFQAVQRLLGLIY